MDVPSSPQLRRNPQSIFLPRKALRRFVRVNRLGPGARVLLVGANNSGLTSQLISLGIDAIEVDSIDQFADSNCEVVVDCSCDFSNSELTTARQWQITSELLSLVRGNGSLCYLFAQDTALTVTSLHKHLLPFAEPAEKPTGRDTSQIHIEIVKSFFSRQPAWCLASLRIPEPAHEQTIWNQRAIQAADVLGGKRSAA